MKIGIEWFQRSPFHEYYNKELACFWILSPITLLFGILFTFMGLMDLATPIFGYIGSLISGNKEKY